MGNSGFGGGFFYFYFTEVSAMRFPLLPGFDNGGPDLAQLWISNLC